MEMILGEMGVVVGGQRSRTKHVSGLVSNMFRCGLKYSRKWGWRGCFRIYICIFLIHAGQLPTVFCGRLQPYRLQEKGVAFGFAGSLCFYGWENMLWSAKIDLCFLFGCRKHAVICEDWHVPVPAHVPILVRSMPMYQYLRRLTWPMSYLPIPVLSKLWEAGPALWLAHQYQQQEQQQEQQQQSSSSASNKPMFKDYGKKNIKATNSDIKVSWTNTSLDFPGILNTCTIPISFDWWYAKVDQLLCKNTINVIIPKPINNL